MKNALFLLGGYYPKPSANGICCEKVMQYLHKEGYNVECIVNRNANTKREEERNGIRIHRIPNIARDRYRELLLSEKGRIKKEIYKLLLRVTNLYEQLAYAPFFPMNSPIRVCKYIIKSEKVIKKSNPELLVSVNMPYDAAIAGMYLKKKHPEIKNVAYFLDPFAGGGYENKLFKTKSAYKKALKTEKKIVSSADIVIAQIEHRKHFESEYSKEILKKVHYLGVPLLENKICETKNKNDCKTVVYAGAISYTYRDPRYIIDVFKYVDSARLVMYVSSGTSWLRKYVSDTNNDNVEIREGITKAELEKVMKNADAFLNIGNSFEMYAPSKIIDYICYGRPIISTYRIDNDTSGYYMRKYPCGLYLDERDNDIKGAGKKIATMLREFSNDISFSELFERYYENTLQAFYEIVK